MRHLIGEHPAISSSQRSELSKSGSRSRIRTEFARTRKPCISGNGRRFRSECDRKTGELPGKRLERRVKMPGRGKLSEGDPNSYHPPHYLHELPSEEEERLERLFVKLDKDGNGRIDIHDLSHALKEFGVHHRYAEVRKKWRSSTLSLAGVSTLFATGFRLGLRHCGTLICQIWRLSCRVSYHNLTLAPHFGWQYISFEVILKIVASFGILIRQIHVIFFN